MNLVYCMVMMLLPIALCYPLHYPMNLNHYMPNYLRQQERQPDRKYADFNYGQQQPLFRFMPPPVQQSVCLPAIWTCGPHLPPCCPGLMCYDGNAKRGRQCVAR